MGQTETQSLSDKLSAMAAQLISASKVAEKKRDDISPPEEEEFWARLKSVNEEIVELLDGNIKIGW